MVPGIFRNLTGMEWYGMDWIRSEHTAVIVERVLSEVLFKGGDAQSVDYATY
jgi:hypothetical protein